MKYFRHEIFAIYDNMIRYRSVVGVRYNEPLSSTLYINVNITGVILILLGSRLICVPGDMLVANLY